MTNYFNSFIGLRTLKTAISVTLGILVARLLGLEYPFFVGMTALIAMERTLQRSVFMGKVRVVGSTIGAAVGICMTYISRGHPALIFIGIILVILICNKLRLQAAITISGIVFLWIMIHVGDASPLFYGFHRIFDSLVGASVSCLVNLIFLPYYNMARLDCGMHRTCDTVLGILDRPGSMIESTELGDIRRSLGELGTLVTLYREEYLSNRKRAQVEEYGELYHCLCDIVTELDAVVRIEHSDIGSEQLMESGKEYHRLAAERQLERITELCAAKGAAAVV